MPFLLGSMIVPRPAIPSAGVMASCASRIPIQGSIIVHLLRVQSDIQPLSGEIIDQDYTPALTLLDLPQFQRVTILYRHKKRLPFAGDQWINNQAQLIHQLGIDKARRRSRAPHKIDVLAGLLLEDRNFFDVSEKACLRPEHRCEGLRKHIMWCAGGEVAPLDFFRRRQLSRHWERPARRILDGGPVSLVARVHAAPEHARIDLRRQPVVVRPRIHPVRDTGRSLDLGVDRHFHTSNQLAHLTFHLRRTYVHHTELTRLCLCRPRLIRAPSSRAAVVALDCRNQTDMPEAQLSLAAFLAISKTMSVAFHSVLPLTKLMLAPFFSSPVLIIREIHSLNGDHAGFEFSIR